MDTFRRIGQCCILRIFRRQGTASDFYLWQGVFGIYANTDSHSNSAYEAKEEPEAKENPEIKGKLKYRHSRI